jgi:hypothetical protein
MQKTMGELHFLRGKRRKTAKISMVKTTENGEKLANMGQFSHET